MTEPERTLRIDQMKDRLIFEFPDWTTTQALTAATTIVDHAADMAARQDLALMAWDVRRDLDRLPVAE